MLRYARIKFKLITRDYAEIAQAIAWQINLANYEKSLTGDEVLKLAAGNLRKKVISVNIVTRIFPTLS